LRRKCSNRVGLAPALSAAFGGISGCPPSRYPPAVAGVRPEKLADVDVYGPLDVGTRLCGSQFRSQN
jgi:hypothetical protein